MNSEAVKKNVWQSTGSNYVRVVLRMGLGLVTFRMLFQGLSKEEFGFWSLLWSVFGYGVLFDFGFGYAAQKKVAELSVHKNWAQLSRVLSTIFFFYFIGAAVLVGAAIALSGPLLTFFKVSAANHDSFRTVMIFFIAGMGLALPMGIFPEVLRGQQRIRAANNIAMAGLVANFLCVAAALHFGWGFTMVCVLALACVLVPDLLACLVALKGMPGVRLNWRLFCMKTVVETSRFSLYAWFNMLGNILRNKSDPVVITSCLSMGAVAPYQAGAKVGEILNNFTKQISDALSPAAAHLHAKGDHAVLREMLMQGIRFSILTATPLLVLCLLFLPDLIRLLTGEKTATPEMLWVGRILLVWYYSLVVTHTVFKRMFMMCGHEKRLMKLGLSEALVNVAASILLVLWTKSIVGVALGSLIPTLYFGWFHLWPWAAKEMEIKPWALFRRVVWPAWAGCAPTVVVMVAFQWSPWFHASRGIVEFVLEAGLAAALAGLGLWKCALTAPERERFAARFTKRLPKLKPA